MRIIKSGKDSAEPRFEITVKDGYGEAYLALVARNNPGACRFRRGRLVMTPRAFLLFSQGMGEALRAVAKAKEARAAAQPGPERPVLLERSRRPRLDAKPIEGEEWWMP